MDIFIHLKTKIFKNIFKLDNQTLIKPFLKCLCFTSTHPSYIYMSTVNMLLVEKGKTLHVFTIFIDSFLVRPGFQEENPFLSSGLNSKGHPTEKDWPLKINQKLSGLCYDDNGLSSAPVQTFGRSEAPWTI